MSSRDFFKKNQTKKGVSRQTLADSINSGTRKKKKIKFFHILWKNTIRRKAFISEGQIWSN